MRATTLTELQRRIEARAERLRGGHRKVPRTENAIRAELDRLGPYIAGEPQSRSRRRALLQLAVKPHVRREAGHYGNAAPPESIDCARAELASLGLHVAAEPGARSRRRAFLRRFIETAEARPARHTAGGWAAISDIPADRTEQLAELKRLGPYTRGEPGRTSRYRAALRRAAYPDDGPPKLTEPSLLGTEGVQAELSRLGPYIPGERRWVSLRRAACERRAAELAIAGYRRP